MTDITTIIELAIKQGFSQAAPLNCSTIELRPEVRQMCEANTCHMYDRCWSCPPGCGSLEECRQKIAAYRYGILVQTTGQLEDDLDGETMMETESLTHLSRSSGNNIRICSPSAPGAAPNVRNAPTRTSPAVFQRKLFLPWKPMAWLSHRSVRPMA